MWNNENNFALQSAITFYTSWAIKRLENKSFEELKKIGLICEEISNREPLHLGINTLKKTFDIDENIKGITPIQVLTLMSVALDLMSQNQYQEKGGIIADSIKQGFELHAVLAEKNCYICNGKAIGSRKGQWLCRKHIGKLENLVEIQYQNWKKRYGY